MEPDKNGKIFKAKHLILEYNWKPFHVFPAVVVLSLMRYLIDY